MALRRQFGVLAVLGILAALSGCGSSAESGDPPSIPTSVEAATVDSESNGTSTVTTFSDPVEATGAPPSSSPSSVSTDELAETYAANWGLVTTAEQMSCVNVNLQENGLSGEVVADAELPLYFVGCGVDVSQAAGGEGRSPLESIVAFLLDDEGVETTDDIVTCATEALVDGFGAAGFLALIAGSGEPTPQDDDIACASFDSCGLDGAAIVGS
jgi:hypothetical protein